MVVQGSDGNSGGRGTRAEAAREEEGADDVERGETLLEGGEPARWNGRLDEGNATEQKRERRGEREGKRVRALIRTR